MSYYVQSVYMVQSISIMNLSSQPLKTRVSSESRMSHNSLYIYTFKKIIWTPLLNPVVYAHCRFLKVNKFTL